MFLTTKLLNQRFLLVKLKLFFRKVLSAIMNWLDITEYLCHKLTQICCACRNHNPVLFSLVTYHRVCIKSNTTGATSEARTTHLSGEPEFVLVFFKVVSFCSCQITCILIFISMLWCPLWFPRKMLLVLVNTISFVGCSCFINVICIYLNTLVSNTISIIIWCSCHLRVMRRVSLEQEFGFLCMSAL